MVKKRGKEFAHALIQDGVSCLTRRGQLLMDGNRAYIEVMEGTFGSTIKCAMLAKHHSNDDHAVLVVKANLLSPGFASPRDL